MGPGSSASGPGSRRLTVEASPAEAEATPAPKPEQSPSTGSGSAVERTGTARGAQARELAVLLRRRHDRDQPLLGALVNRADILGRFVREVFVDEHPFTEAGDGHRQPIPTRAQKRSHGSGDFESEQIIGACAYERRCPQTRVPFGKCHLLDADDGPGYELLLLVRGVVARRTQQPELAMSELFRGDPFDGRRGLVQKRDVNPVNDGARSQGFGAEGARCRMASSTFGRAPAAVLFFIHCGNEPPMSVRVV